MVLKGQAKKDYQREYMREYRLKKQVVRPSELDLVQPSTKAILACAKYLDDAEVPTNNRKLWFNGRWYETDADGSPIYEE